MSALSSFSLKKTEKTFLVEKSLRLPGNPPWPDGLRDIPEEIKVHPTPPSTVQPGSHYTDGLWGFQMTSCLGPLSPGGPAKTFVTSVKLYSKSCKHRFRAQGTPSARFKESWEEGKQNEKLVVLLQGWGVWPK